MNDFLQNPWVQRVAFAGGGLVLGLLVERLIVARFRRIAAATAFKWDDLLVTSLRGLPTIWFAVAGIYFALAVEGVELGGPLRTAITIVLIGSVAVAGMRFAGGAVAIMSAHAMGGTQSPTLIANLAKVAVALLAGVLLLENLGIDITPLITALGIGGLAVALAMQDTLGNLFAGVHIILSRQVRQGDFVRLSTGEEGRVTDVKARNTTIQTVPDGNLLTVPNSVLATSIVKNYTLPKLDVWLSVNVGVAYGSDLDEVERVTIQVARESLAAVEGGMPNEPPIVLYREFATSSIDLVVRMLVRDYQSQGAVRHDFIKRLHRRYAEVGIEIPFPTQTVINRTPTAD
jgi:small-conductance mechanosensitive channel